jgi:hypothetical protein
VSDILKNSLEVVVVYILSQISGRLSEILFPGGAVTFLFAAAAARRVVTPIVLPGCVFYGCKAAGT